LIQQLCSLFFTRLLHPDNREVGQKLGLATALMFTLPLVTFFVAQYFFRHKSEPDNWAGGAAILMTNIIISGYCYVAFKEDSDKTADERDEAGPRVGIYKQRTD
jgi:hypothetical protein